MGMDGLNRLLYDIWRKMIFHMIKWIWIGVFLNMLIIKRIWKAFSDVLELAEDARISGRRIPPKTLKKKSRKI